MSDSVRLKPYNGHIDFAMWKLKMKAILVKEKCWKAVSEDWPKDIKEEDNKDLQESAHLEIIIRLADDVARQRKLINLADAGQSRQLRLKLGKAGEGLALSWRGDSRRPILSVRDLIYTLSSISSTRVPKSGCKGCSP